jgi:FKBP-type peptidyl-prolyl cis-trans isomerase
MHGAGFAEETISEIDKVNYSLGYELGKDLKRQELELRQEMLLQGAKDAIEGNNPKVNSRERRQALAEIKAKRAQDNLEKSQIFLAEKAKMEDVVSTPSGLLYRVLQAGEGKTPGATDKVTVNYRGTLIDGSQFDSSYDRGKPSNFKVDKVIKGWSEALQLMQEGSKWELYIPPGLAYGKRGRKPIPPNSALIFEVELISVN